MTRTSLLALVIVCSTSAITGQEKADDKTEKPDPESALGVPQFTLGESGNTVRIAAAEGSVSLSATVTGSEKLTTEDLTKYAQTLVLIDKGWLRGVAPAAVVEFGKAPEFVGRTGTSGLTWRIDVRTRDLPPGTAHVRQAQATLGSKPTQVAFDYTVTSKPAAAAQWEVKGASPVWTLSWSDLPIRRRYEVVIANQDEPIRGVRLVQSTLRTTSGHLLGVDRLKLFDAANGADISGVDVQPNTLRPIRLEVQPREGFGEYGTFQGQLRFAADGSAVMKDVEVQVQASSASVKTAGVLLTLLGLGVTAWTAFLRARAARVSALRPALVLAESTDKLARELQNACAECHGMTRVLVALKEAISETELDNKGLLPSRFVFASSQPAADTAAGLKSHLEKVSNKLAGLGILLREGINVLKRGNATNRDVLIRELDAAAESVQGTADARTTTTAVLAKQVFPARVESAAQQRVEGTVSSVADSDHAIKMIAGISWFLWAVISLAVSMVWIVSDVDYGAPVDLIGSFLWGFGASLQGLTTSGVATQVNLKLPG